jgi:hypothetical protein
MQIRRLNVLDSLIPWVYKTYLSHGVGKRYFPGDLWIIQAGCGGEPLYKRGIWLPDMEKRNLWSS